MPSTATCRQPVAEPAVATRWPWWVVVSNPSCERRATMGLEEAGFEVWWPTFTKLVRFGPRREKRDRTFPLYPGYLFVRSTGAAIVPKRRIVGVQGDMAVEVLEPVFGELQQILRIDGVRAVLCNMDHEPLRISDTDVQELRQQCERDAMAMPIVEDAWRIGDEVIITEGPFAGLRAAVERLLGKYRVEVAVGLLRGAAPLCIARTMAEKV